jgi:hypothetical protein
MRDKCATRLQKIILKHLSAIEAVIADGGELVQPIGADAPEITARFRDPGGNVVGLYQQPAGEG